MLCISQSGCRVTYIVELHGLYEVKLLFAPFDQRMLQLLLGVLSKTAQHATLLVSLHEAAGARQEVLDVSDSRFGEIRHGAKAPTGGAVIKKIADSRCWVLFKEIFTRAMGFLVREEKVISQMQDAIHVNDSSDAVHVDVGH